MLYNAAVLLTHPYVTFTVDFLKEKKFSNFTFLWIRSFNFVYNCFMDPFERNLVLVLSKDAYYFQNLQCTI